MPWEKKKKPADPKTQPKDDAVSTVGALQHYIVQESLDEVQDLSKPQ